MRWSDDACLSGSVNLPVGVNGCHVNAIINEILYISIICIVQIISSIYIWHKYSGHFIFILQALVWGEQEVVREDERELILNELYYSRCLRTDVLNAISSQDTSR